jgi:hypothetical protein
MKPILICWIEGSVMKFFSLPYNELLLKAHGVISHSMNTPDIVMEISGMIKRTQEIGSNKGPINLESYSFMVVCGVEDE